MSDKKPFIITEYHYKVCMVINSLDELRQKGLVEGGYDIDKEGIKSIIYLGQKCEFNKPTEDEYKEIINDIQCDLAQSKQQVAPER